MNKSRIAITGTTGFVGSNLLDKLYLSEYFGVVFNRSKLALNGKFDNKFISIEVPSFCDYNFKNDLIGVDCIIHCAARAHIMQDEVPEPLTEYRLVNVQGTLNLARCAVAAGVKRFIYISSIKVNGESTSVNTPFYSSDTLKPNDFYGQSKAEAEEQLIELSKSSGLEVVIIRPTLVYGQGVKANFNTLMKFVSNVKILPFSCIDKNKRSLVSIDNLVDLIITCVDHPKAANEVFLVSDDHDVSTSEMVRELSLALGKTSWQLPIPIWCYNLVGRLFNKSSFIQRLTGSLHVDITHTKNTLDWTPPQTLREGFTQTAKAFLKIKK